MQHLRLVFMGTPDFSVPALHALIEAGHDLRAVYCQPPKPQGRGHAVQKTPIHLAAEAKGLVVRTPPSLRDEAEIAFLRAEDLDFIVVAAYGLLLPPAVLDSPRFGCVNIHASLLPRWRGAAPIHRAILAGDTLSGVTIMQMEAGLDTGPMWKAESVALDETTTAESLHDALAALGAKMIVPVLDEIAHGKIRALPQPEVGVTYAAKLTRAEGKIEWNADAESLERRIRALTPWPGTFFMLGAEAIKVLEAEIVEGNEGEAPGTLLDDTFRVACGSGSLRLLKVQKPGKGPMDGASFLRGHRLADKTVLS